MLSDVVNVWVTTPLRAGEFTAATSVPPDPAVTRAGVALTEIPRFLSREANVVAAVFAGSAPPPPLIMSAVIGDTRFDATYELGQLGAVFGPEKRLSLKLTVAVSVVGVSPPRSPQP